MDPERPQVVLEENEQLQEDINPALQQPEPDLGAEVDGQRAPKPQGPGKGKEKKLTEYFNSMGGQNTSKAHNKTQNGARAPKTLKNSIGTGGVSKTPIRRKKNKIEEPERARMELALRAFLREKKPPDKTTTGGGVEGSM